MTDKNETIASVAPKEVIITRILNAPRELVFEAYTNPKHVAKWFGPRIFTATAEADLRKGGAYHYAMIGTDQAPPEFKGPYPMKGVYLEFIRPEKVMQTTDLTDHPEDWKELIKSNIANYNGQDFLHSVTTVIFEEIGDDKTKVTISEKFDSDEVRDAYFKTGMKEGWAESLDKLEELLEKNIK
ncbi:MAG: SRPBCC domain-containing protein [Ignavibacteriota bacterium]